MRDRPSDFAAYILQITSKPVQMMSMKEKLQVFYIESPQAMGLQLYYESRDLSLLILLPENIGGLDQVKGSVYSYLSLFLSPLVTFVFSLSQCLFCKCKQNRFSHVWLCAMDPSSSSAHGILQARILGWVAISFSGGPSQSRDQTCVFYVSCIRRQVLYH